MNNKCLLGVDKGGTNHPLFSSNQKVCENILY
jgi:hypothetical protein